MKSFWKILSAVFVMTGSVIGAGFATGKEIYVFFYGGNSYAVGALCFILFFAAFLSVSLFARKFSVDTPNKMFKILFGKFGVVADAALSLCLFFVLSTMIAAANLCLSDLFGIDEKFGVFAVVTAAAVSFALEKGMKGVRVINAVAVPLIITFVVFMCANGTGAEGDCKALSSAAYVCFNVVMMCGVLVSLAKNMTVKENVIASLVTSLILGALICLELTKLNEPVYRYVPMPLISIAKSRGYWLYVAATAVLYMSILTTILSSAFPLVNRLESFIGGKRKSVWLLMITATDFSYFGFDAIIGYTYPAIAVFGVVILASVIFVLLKTKKSGFPAHDSAFG